MTLQRVAGNRSEDRLPAGTASLVTTEARYYLRNLLDKLFPCRLPEPKYPGKRGFSVLVSKTRPKDLWPWRENLLPVGFISVMLTLSH